MKNTFVQLDEKRAKYREIIVRSYLLMSDDTPGKVCIELLNDTPGRVVSKEGKTGVREVRKNLCTA